MRRFGLILALLAYASVARAEPPFLEVVKRKYGTGTCQTCHTQPPVRNVFGQAVEKELQRSGRRQVNEQILSSLEQQDADADGISNGDELRKGTLPGVGNNGAQESPRDSLPIPSHAFHPLVVHCPIALFLFGGFLEVLGHRRKDEGLRRLASWNLTFGAIASVLAVGSGLAAFVLGKHELAGIPLLHLVCALSACLTMLTVVALKRKNPDGTLYWILLALACGFTAVAGHLGATIVFG